MIALALLRALARLAVVVSRRLADVPERALVMSMAQRLVDEVGYFGRAVEKAGR